MKVYHSGDNGSPKKGLGRKGFLAIGLSTVMLVAALAVTLTLVLRDKPNEPDVDVNAPIKIVYSLPVDNFELGKEFSNERLVKYKTMGFWETHEAVDFLTTSGASVMAVSGGTITSVEKNTSMYGTVVTINHGEGLVSIYKGLSAIVDVQVGATVKAGDKIGTVGIMTMEKNDYDKPHLHLEMTKNGVLTNPLSYLPEIGDK